jgi:alkylation response protein AidB-like acyl-CoA dehydrogenase
MKKTTLDGVRIIEIPEYRDRLLRIQGEVLASKFHGLRLLTEQAKGNESGVSRLIVKLNGTMIAHRLSSLAVDVLGAAGLPYEPQGEALEDDEATTWQIDNMYDIGLIIGGGSSNIQRNIIGERGLGLPREPKANIKPGTKG